MAFFLCACVTFFFYVESQWIWHRKTIGDRKLHQPNEEILFILSLREEAFIMAAIVIKPSEN